ncbi:MAG: glycosyltransferase family 2 protein [Cytophagales bacterium]|nr:glycosyltransferase family 2 protein [Armatimonadota bacterium]
MSWNAREDLRVCLRSIEGGSSRPETVETWVLDNASTDGSAEMVAREFSSVHLIRSETNRGFSGGNNPLLENLGADYALLLNSDAVCHPGAFDTLLSWADANPKAGIIGPKVLNTDGSLQFSCRRFPTFAAGLFRNVYLGRLFPNNKPAADYLMQDFDHAAAREVDWVSGCVLLIRRACLDAIGPLDAETFFMYCEDMDWCLRAHNADWSVVYAPDAVFTHAIGRSSDHAAERMIVEHHRSMWRFYKKHQAFFDPQIPLLLRPLVPVGIVSRVAVRIARRRYINPLLNLLRGGKQPSPSTPSTPPTTSESNVHQASSSTG